MLRNNIYKKIVITILAIIIVGSNFANIFVNTAHAAINKEINYQGKLTNASNVAVADGLYTMEFKLYSVLTGGAALWTETLNSTNKVQVTNGIFSVMLGSTTPFTGVDFNQTLYLGVKIEADSEMTPRKIIGAVPAAFVADTVDGVSSEEFLRSDAQNATSTSSTFLSILQTGSGKIAEFFGNVSQSVLSILSNGNVGIGSSTPYAALSVVGASGVVADHFTSTSTQNASVFPYASTTALTVAGRVYTSDATVSNTITLASLNGPLQAVNGLVSASSTISTAFGGTGLSTTPSYGSILVGQANGTYTLTATSSLGLAAFAFPFTQTSNFNAINQATTGIAWFQNGFNASSTSHIASTTFDISGNVGIGSTSPFAKLSISGLAGQTNPFFAIASTSGATPFIQVASTSNFQIDGGVIYPTHKGSLVDGSGGASLNSPISVYVSGNYAYLVDYIGNALEIVDISNPAAPVHKGSLANGVGGASISAPRSIYVSGNYAYIASSAGNALEIVDISNPAAPVHKGSLANGVGGALLSTPASVFVSGNYAYLASSGSNALEIVDISNPAVPVHKGSLVDGTGGSQLNSAWSVYVSGNYAYVVSSGSSALEIVNISNPAAPVHKGSLVDGSGGATINTPRSVFVSGNYAYIASTNGNALEIVDISNPSSPVHKGSLANGSGGALINSPQTVFVSGNYAYLASSGSNALEIVDISNPASPTHKGSISNGSGGALLSLAESVFVSGNYAYVASFSSLALEVVDVGALNVSNAQIGTLKVGNLSVDAFAQFNNNLLVNSNLNVGQNALIGGGLSISGFVSTTTSNTNYAALTIGNGNVAIGTTTPTARLTIAATSTLSNTTLLSVVAVPSAGATTTALTVLSNANVGVGTTTPWRALSVSGSSDLGNNALAGYFTATSSTASTFPYASSTALTVSGTGYFGTASTTNLTISSIASGSLLKTTTAGSVIAAVAGVDFATVAQVAFPFTPTTFGATNANATGTLMGFTSGIYSLASSTIGAGGQTTGLTISGGATTTGNAYFGSTLGVGTSSPFGTLSISPYDSTTPALYIASSTNADATLFEAKGGYAKAVLQIRKNSGYIGSFVGTTSAAFTNTGYINDGNGSYTSTLGASYVGSYFAGAAGLYVTDNSSIALWNPTAATGAGTASNKLSWYNSNGVDSGRISYLQTAEISPISEGVTTANSAPTSIIFKTNPGSGAYSTLNEAMRIGYNGNVGIGTTSPYAKLSVAGQIVGAYFTATSSTASSSIPFLTGGVSSDLTINTDTNKVLKLQPSFGKVSIGNGTASYSLDVFGNLSGVVVDNVIRANSAADYASIAVNATKAGGTGQANVILQKNGTNAFQFGLDFATNGTKDFFVYDATAGDNPFYISSTGDIRLGSTNANSSGGYWNTQRMTILASNGNVGVGYTSPSTRMSVFGAGLFADNVNSSYFTATSSTASTFPYASTTALSATTICITTDCRTAWPSAGGGAYPFTVASNFNVNNQATTGIAWFQNGFNASSTSHIASTTFDISGNVGIGSTSPFATLSVFGNSYISGFETASYFTATSSTASTFPYASTTALSATTICITTDCRTSWPTGSAYEFTSTSNFAVINQATTGIAWFQNGFNASSTSRVGSTTFLVNGNVGVGTTTPNWMLSVAGMGYIGDNVISSYFTATSSTATSTFAGGMNIGSGNLVYDSYTGVTSVNAAEMGNLNFDTDAGVVSWVDMDVTTTSVQNTVNSYTALLDANPMLTIFGKSDGLGNLIATSTGVGIGTTTPLAMLDIFAGSSTPFTTGFMSNYDALSITNQATSSFANTIKTGLRVVSTGPWTGAGSSNMGLYISSVTGGAKNYDAIFNGGGTVGIGTTSPNWMLQIASTSASNTMKGQLALSDMGAGTNLKHWLFSSNNGNLYISTSTDAYATSTMSALTVNQNGYLAIGSTTPSSRLVVGGSSYLGTGTNDSLVLHVGSINYPVAATTTLSSTLNSFSMATSTAVGGNSVFNMSFSSTGASTTIGFFVSTSTGLEAGKGLGLGSALKQMIVVGNGKTQAGMVITKGGLCVDNDGWCTASTSGQVSARVLATGGSDVAENYPSNVSLYAGDIVSTLEHGFVTLAQKVDEAKILGVVSTAPGLVLGSDPDDGTNPGTRYPIALAGRVPVKISLENGGIAVGDSLALSDTIPGTAMKAKISSKVIGIALDKYDTSSVGGSVLMFVSNNAKNDTHAQVAESLSQYVSFATSTNNSLFKNSITVTGSVTADTLIATNIQSPALDLINTKISDLASSTSNFEDRIKTLEATSTLKLSDLLNASTSLTFNNTVIFNGGLKVNSISSVGDVIDLASDVNIIGRPYFNQDVAGFVLIKKDSKKANVVFNKEYSEQPIVTASMAFNEGDSEAEQEIILSSNMQSIITKKSTKGFTIILNKPAPYDIRFSWIALAVKNAKVSTSSDTETINPVIVTPIVPIVVPVDSTTTVPTVSTTTSADTSTSTPTSNPVPVEPTPNVPTIPEPSPTDQVPVVPTVPSPDPVPTESPTL